ncbi:hypothetical protein FCULG_00012835 [Fusarium culmorum]|uniref:Uncharacterized protein n=1 Tax=Fusarium culmorum TaxID=5516 RepID=A0A2T4GIU2_FUSCU|nr:hypothetical protein FCULG_00012835 [Fusarium culmorum]
MVVFAVVIDARPFSCAVLLAYNTFLVLDAVSGIVSSIPKNGGPIARSEVISRSYGRVVASSIELGLLVKIVNTLSRSIGVRSP